MRCAYDIRLTPAPDAAAVLKLYREIGWVRPDESGVFVPAMLRGSLLTVSAVAEDGELIGFARVISDGASDAYIQDVMVAPLRRKQGIARAMVRRLVAELHERGVDWIGLIAVPECRELYEKLGFSELPDHTPMRYTGDCP